jgi:hypothetical protein
MEKLVAQDFYMENEGINYFTSQDESLQRKQK